MKRWLVHILLAVIMVGPGVSGSQAAPNDLRDKYQDVKKQLEQGQGKLDQIKQAESITLEELEITTRELDRVSRELKNFRARLSRTRQKLSGLQADISKLQDKVSLRKDWIRRKLQAMQRHGKYGDVLLMLGSSDDLPQLLRRWHYLGVLASVEAAVLEELKRDVNALREKKEELARIEKRLELEEADVRLTERKLRQQKQMRLAMLNKIRKQEKTYERMLRELRKSAARMQKLIQQSEGGAYYGDSNFRRSKGRLPWPVEGRVAIPYGTQKDPEFNTPVFRNGIYISTFQDSVARAVHPGRVVYADWFKGYGQLVIINHGGGYHSLYANLSEIFLKAGDIIERDARIGKVGTSGMLDSPSLYFEVRYKGRPLNPSRWLKDK